jgi:solute carrier family 5 (sodium-coupled monocarboxylate transporter), member 8/12
MAERNTVEALKDSLIRFGTVDYIVFIAMLLSCSIVGLYFGIEDYKRRKKMKNCSRGQEAKNYLMGGRKMQIFPVAMSLVASCISGIALLGN